MTTRLAVTPFSRVLSKFSQHRVGHQLLPSLGPPATLFSSSSGYSCRHFFSLPDVLCQVFDWKSVSRPTHQIGSLDGPVWIRSNCRRNIMHKAAEPVNKDVIAADAKTNVKKKVKGKRQVVRMMKFFRFKKKKEFERMTAEEKILYKLKKARNKEARLMEALKKLEPSDSSAPIHDPEILTPEEHFYFLKMGVKSKNYVPVGRRGIYQGVILNMHLHWKKHQTLKVIVKTFTPEEVKEIAAELARLSGGIVLDIQDDDTIIMYRGKNYSQPPTEIMSPKISLPRIKALNKSKYRDGLRAVRKFIPSLEHDLELLQEQAKRKHESRFEPTDCIQETKICESKHRVMAGQQQRPYNGKERMGVSSDLDEDSTTESGMISESECLSDIFETDSDKEVEEKIERPLYLDAFEKFPALNNEEPGDFDDHLRQIAHSSKNGGQAGKDLDLPDLDEVDRIFLRAGSLLKQKRR